MASLIMLDEKKLRTLAELVWRQEVGAIETIQFNSEYDRGKYLRDSRASYDSVIGVLDSGGKAVQEFKNDDSAADRESIAHKIYGYLLYGLNMALQTVPHYYMRLDYVKKIGEHGDSLIKILKELDPNSTTFLSEAEDLAETAVKYKDIMLEYSTKYDSSASKYFSKWIADNNLTFEDIVQMYKGKLKFEGPFEALEDTQKLKVYEEIIKDSGRGGTKWATVKGAAGVVVILATAAMMVWDIYSSEHKLETATRDAVSIAAGIAGATLGEVVIAALGTLEGVEATDFFVVAIGTLTGIAGGFIIGAFAGFLIGLIFASGGSAKMPPLSTDGFQCYVSPLPDGVALARQLVHQD